MADIGKAYVQIIPKADGISNKIEAQLSGAGAKGGAAFNKGFTGAIGSVGKAAGGALVAAAAAGTAAITGMVKAATSSFANYEQLVGGVETLFKDSSSQVIQNADNAFRTAGLSANDYMETVTAFSASLLQSVGGNTAEAAKVADMALQDMSDNANKMGTSMQSIQYAYQGFAKQNYTMLDNLKLGYGGTKSEMQRLLADAQKLTGVKYDLSNLDDVYNAIHAIQDNLGITGTTAKEAASTITGSLNMTKAAWENVLSSLGQGDTNVISEKIDQLVESTQTFAGNLMPVIQRALTGVSQLISQLAPELATMLSSLLPQVLPELMKAVLNIVETFGETLLSIAPQMVELGVQLIGSLGQGLLNALPRIGQIFGQVAMIILPAILNSLPRILQAGIQLITMLGQGIAEAIPTLMPIITQCIVDLVGILSDPGNLEGLLQAGLAIILALGQGLLEALPQLIAALPTIIDNLVQFIVAATPQLVEAAMQLTMAIIQATPQIATQIAQMAPQIVQSLAEGLIAAAPILLAQIPMMIAQVGEAILQAIPQLLAAVAQIFAAIIATIGQYGGQLLANIQTHLQNIMANIESTLGQLPYQLGYIAGTAVTNFVTFIQQLPGKVVTAFNNVIAKLKDFANKFIQEGPRIAREFASMLIQNLSSLPGQVAEIAGAIVQALKDGILAKWEDLKSSVSGAVSDFVQGMKDAASSVGGGGGEKKDNGGGGQQKSDSGTKTSSMAATLSTQMFDVANEAVASITTANNELMSYHRAIYSANMERETSNQNIISMLSEYLPMITSQLANPVPAVVGRETVFDSVNRTNQMQVMATGYSPL